MRQRKQRTRGRRRGLRLESLESRRLLVAATDLASIVGRVIDDFTGDGFTAGEQVANAALDLYRDDGDGIPEPNNGDPEERMVMTDANGFYAFDRLTAGTYFIVQPAQTVDGRSLQRSVSSIITIAAADVAGRLITTIDAFDQTTQSVRDETNNNTAVVDGTNTATGEAIGGARDLIVSKTTDDGAVEIVANGALAQGRLSFRSEDFGDGVRRVIWDGSGDDPATVNDDGLGSIDLTSGGDAAGLRLVVGADLPDGDVIVRFYTDDGVAGTNSRVSQATLEIPRSTTTPTSVEFVPFTSFTGNADLTQVGAIELEVVGGPNYDAIADLVGTIGPNEFTVDFNNFEEADLELSKTASTDRVNGNETFTFDVTLRNNGPDTATDIVVADVLPAGIALVSQSATRGTYNQTSGRWEIDDLALNNTASLTLTVRLTGTTAQTNTAEIIAAGQLDPDSTPNNGGTTEDDRASATVTPAQVDLELAKSVTNSRPNLNEEITFTLTLVNQGPDTATSVVVRDVLPSGLVLLGTTPSTGSFSAAGGQWTIPSLAPNTPVTLDLRTRVNTEGPFVNTAEVISVAQPDVDSTPGNNNLNEDDQSQITVETQTIDLSIQKTASTLTPNTGETVTFTVTVQNNGPDDATNVQIRDVLPTGLSLSNSSTTAGTYSPGTGLWQIDRVAVGSSVIPTLTINAVVDTRTAVTNVAEVIAADQRDSDSIPDNGSTIEDDRSAVTIDPPSIDLQLAKSVTPLRPATDDEIAFQLVLQNTGPDTATGIVISDVLPPGLAFVDASATLGSYSSATGRWTVASLPSNQSATLTLNTRLAASRGDLLASITNTAEVIFANQFDIDSTPDNGLDEDDRSSATVTPARADLSLQKTVNDPNPDVGESVTFTVAVRNDGPDVADGIIIADPLPAGSQLVRVDAEQGNYENSTGRWNLGSLAVNQTRNLELVVTAGSDTVITNVAAIIASDVPDPDSTPNNGVASEDDQDDASIDPQQIDLEVAVAVDDPTPRLDDVVTFTITATNNGPDDATSVVIAEQLPSGLTLVSASPETGSFNSSTRQWTIDRLAANRSLDLLVRARVNSTNTLTNSARVLSADQADSDSIAGNDIPTEDDQDAVTVQVPVADLEVSKSVDVASANVGQSLTFTIVVANDGPNDATGVVIRDQLPAGLDYVSDTTSRGSYDAGSGRWSIDEIPANTSATLTLLANVEDVTTQTNTAEVIASDQDDPDSTPNNNTASEDDQASVQTKAPEIDLELSKAVQPTRPSVNGETTFTLTLRNQGPDDATNIVIQEVLPAGFELTSAFPPGVFDSATQQWSVSSLAAGQQTELQLIGLTRESVPFTNRAQVIAADQFDRDSTPNSGLDDGEDDRAEAIVSPASADLVLAKSVSETTPNFGDEVTFELRIENNGPDPTSGVMVRDVLPDGLILINAPSQYNAITGVWDVGDLAVDQARTLNLRTRVEAESLVTNNAEVIASTQRDPDSTPNNGPNDEDDFASATLMAQRVDLALSKVSDRDRVDFGETVTFTLSLQNEGPSRATNIRVEDVLPDGLRFIRSSGDGSFQSADGIWTIGSLNAGASVDRDIVVEVESSSDFNAVLDQAITSIAQVIAVDQPDRDSEPDNNVAGEDDQADVSLQLRQSDLEVSVAFDDTTPDRNQVVEITTDVFNRGPDNATNIVLRNPLPSGLEFVSSSADDGSYDPNTGRWNLGALPSNATSQLRIQARVLNANPGAYSAQIQAAGQLDSDSVPANSDPSEDDQAAASVSPRVVDIAVDVTVDNDEPMVGDIVNVTVRASAADGLADATGVTVRTELPDDVTLLSQDTGTVGTYDPSTGLWDIGALGSGEQAVLTLSMRVIQRGIKQQTAEVVATDQFDRDSTPNNAVETEDDQNSVTIRAPRRFTKRTLLAR
ncbi:MAG: DUF11 domain-containing protein [Planctomycetota bacterium]